MPEAFSNAYNFVYDEVWIINPSYKFLFWCITVDAVLLGWIGTCVPETPYIEIGQVCSVFYFVYFLVLLPCLSVLENKLLRKSLV